MVAGAGRFAHPGTEAPVMYWGGNVYPDLPIPGDEPLRSGSSLTPEPASSTRTYPTP